MNIFVSQPYKFSTKKNKSPHLVQAAYQPSGGFLFYAIASILSSKIRQLPPEILINQLQENHLSISLVIEKMPLQ